MLTIDKGKPFLIFKDKYCVTYICLLIFYIYIPSLSAPQIQESKANSSNSLDVQYILEHFTCI